MKCKCNAFTQFLLFLENISPGRERVQLPPTIDRDDEDEEDKKTSQVCYFILPDGDNSTELFAVDAISHILTAKARLDREKQATHNLTVLATENCHQDVTRLNLQTLDKGSKLKVTVAVRGKCHLLSYFVTIFLNHICTSFQM